ncbi:MAG: signal peptide peptidase SppA [Proteobacteria bacterium]|nr:signal peptide peptidase SppA [Pseudomonadota bacterium]
MRKIAKFLFWGFASIGIFVVLAIVGAIVIVAFGDSKSALPEKIVLALDLSAGVVEKAPDGPWNLLKRRGGGLVLRTVVDGLQRAGRDERVRGLVVRMGGGGISIAQTQEIRNAIAQFRKSGKFTVAFADTFGGAENATAEYYLSAALEEVWLQPSGELALTGLSLEVPFFKDALEKLEIEAMIGKRHEFKGAPDSMLRSSMSAPVRRSLQGLVSGWLDQIVNGIAQDRKLSKQAVRALIDRGPFGATEAKTAKLIDRLAYWDELESDLKERTGEESIPWVDISDYGVATKKGAPKGPHVAFIIAEGTIISGHGDGFDEKIIAGGDLADTIYGVADDKEIKGILLRIDSPGGVYTAADTVWRALEYAKKKGKKIVVSMGHAAASGGYFIAMAADRIVAQPGTVTGSIGVYGGKVNLQGFWRKLGVRWDEVHAGSQATMWSMNRGFPEEAQKRVDYLLDRIYADFTGKAAAARKLSADAMDSLARGRVWTGRQALQGKLIDRLGGIDIAIAELKILLGVPEDKSLRLVPTPPQKSRFELIEDFLSGDIRMTEWASVLSGQLQPAWRRAADPFMRDLAGFAPPVGRLQMPAFHLKR